MDGLDPPPPGLEQQVDALAQQLAAPAGSPPPSPPQQLASPQTPTLPPRQEQQESPPSPASAMGQEDKQQQQLAAQAQQLRQPAQQQQQQQQQQGGLQPPHRMASLSLETPRPPTEEQRQATPQSGGVEEQPSSAPHSAASTPHTVNTARSVISEEGFSALDEAEEEEEQTPARLPQRVVDYEQLLITPRTEQSLELSPLPQRVSVHKILGEPEPIPATPEQQAGFLELLEELGVGSIAGWQHVERGLEQECSGDPRFASLPLPARAPLFNQYIAQQAALERQVEELEGKPWAEVLQESASMGVLGLHHASLEQLPASIGELEGLQVLDLRGCSSLQRLPVSVCHLSSLQFLELHGCGQLQHLPANLGLLANLQSLDASGCEQLEQLPASVAQLGELQSVNLSGCSKLRQVPDGLGRLRNLQSLNLSGCSQLQELPVSTGQLAGLYTLDLDHCTSLERLPACIGQLRSLLSLSLAGCTGLQALPDTVGQLGSLEALSLSGCTSLKQLPGSITQIGTLKTLETSGCSQLASLPPLGRIKALRTLDVSGCSNLRELPDLGDCADLDLDLSPTSPGGQRAQMQTIRVPLDHLPPRLQQTGPGFVLSQAEALQRSLTSTAWIAVLLAIASFIGFVTVPGGWLNLGRIQLQLKGTKVNRTAMRTYFIANIMTFFLALATAAFCVSETMPAATPQTARRIVLSLLSSTFLLFLTIGSAGTTFLSAAYSVYPPAQYNTLIYPTAFAGFTLVVVFFVYTRRVWALFFKWRRAQAAAPFPNLVVTVPQHSPADRLYQLRSILTR